MKFLFCFAIFLAATLAVVECYNNENSRDIEKTENSWISKFVDKVVHWIKSLGKDVGAQCFAKRKQGKAPSAEKGDSPIKTFGYPYFNVKHRGVVLKGETPLSVIGGFRQPIKIGSRDYIFAGYPEEILAFCACFENYKVIGESLSKSGHWVHDGRIKIQLQNVQKFGGRLDSSIFEVLFKYTIERIIKYLNPVKIIEGIDCKILGGCDAVSTVEKFRETIQKIRGWLPGSDVVIKKIIEIYQKKGTLEEKAKELIEFIKGEEERQAKIRGHWIGLNNVDYKHKKIIVTLTMYSKPNNHVRSTYTMKSAQVSMKDIGEAIKEALDKKN